MSSNPYGVQHEPGETAPAVAPMTELGATGEHNNLTGDPAIDGAIDDGITETDGNTERTGATAEEIRNAAEKEEEGDSEEAERLRRLRGKGGEDGRGDGENGDNGPGGDRPGTNPSNDALGSQNPGQGSPQTQSPQMPQTQMPQSQTPSTSMPLGNMTQADMNNAPNRDERVKELKEKGDGSRTGLNSRSGDPDEAEVQEYLKKLEAEGIDYVWGGGHGGAPGSSQGIRDGGVADSFGDYKKSGLDCSGLARLVTYDLHGVDINGTAANQYNMGKPISASEARAGDIFFPSSAGRPPQHVQVYAGGDQVFEAQKSGTKLKFSPLTDGEFRRYT